MTTGNDEREPVGDEGNGGSATHDGATPTDDGVAATHDGATPEGTRPGDQVGLGHVVANEAGIGDGEPATTDGPLVEAASEASFPASDPPGFTSEPATSAERHDQPPRAGTPSGRTQPWTDRDTLELPNPRDVP